MKLSIIVPSLTGEVPESLIRAVEGRAEVEIVVVKGISPVGKARNDGLRRAKGEYIAWVDSDDEVSPNYVETILRQVKDVEAVVIDYVHDHGAWRQDKVWLESGRGPFIDLLSGRLTPQPWRYVMHRRLWDGKQFNEEEEIGEDYRLMPEILENVHDFARAGIVYRYIVHPDSLVHQESALRTRQRLVAAEDRLRRWSGTKLEGLVLFDVLRMVGWMHETNQHKADTLMFLRRYWWCAIWTKEVSFKWKLKLTYLIIGVMG